MADKPVEVFHASLLPRRIGFAEIPGCFKCCACLLLSSELQSVVVGDGQHPVVFEGPDDPAAGFPTALAPKFDELPIARFALSETQNVAGTPSSLYQVRLPVSMPCATIHHSRTLGNVPPVRDLHPARLVAVTASSAMINMYNIKGLAL